MTALRLRAGRCQCDACGLRFSSVREFDRHRTGHFAKLGEWKGTRRCLGLAQLMARGWRVDTRGYLMQGRPQRAPAAVLADCEDGAASDAAGVPS